MMLHKLEKASEQADYLIETAKQRPEKLIDFTSSTSKWKSIHQKLLDLYLEESKTEPTCKKLKCSSKLLHKLVQREQLQTVILNLYLGNDGFSLMLRARNSMETETIRLPYEESELLEYVDNEELPPMLLDLLDKLHSHNVFYSGCVIMEIRDYRRRADGSHDTKYVLLRPSPHSLMSDLNSLTADGHIWSQEDKLRLESELLLATNEPLCLDPSPTAFYVANRLSFEKTKFATQALKKSVKKFSQAAVNRKRKMEQCSAPKHLRLHDFIAKKKEKLLIKPPFNLKLGKSCVDMWKQQEVSLTVPEELDVEKYAKVLDKTKVTSDNTPVVVEEITFETERTQNKINYSRLTILQRQSDDFYLGVLYVDRDYSETNTIGSTCKFALGTRANVDKYIRQFREIFTEEGRRQVKITHQAAGQQASVSYTQAVPSASTTPQPQQVQQQHLLTQAANLAATITGQLSIPGSDGSSKRHPIKLSLSINPQAVPTSPSSIQVQSPQLGGGGTATVTLNLAQQQQLAQAQRIRNMAAGMHSNRSPTTPSPGHNSVNNISLQSLGSGRQSATPPPNVTISTPSRRGQPDNQSINLGNSTVTTPTGTTGYHMLSLSGSGSGQNLAAAAAAAAGASSAAASAAANDGSGISSLPTGPNALSLQNLSQITGLHGLHNVQVSMASLTAGGIAVPVTLLNSPPPNFAPPTPTSAGQSSQQAAVATTTATQQQQQHHQQPTFVTMVTAIPANISTPTSSLSSITSTTLPVTSGGMLSLPLGNLTQLMTAAGIKTPPGGLRQPLLLSQVPGQQSLQLLSATSLSHPPRLGQQQQQLRGPNLLQLTPNRLPPPITKAKPKKQRTPPR